MGFDENKFSRDLKKGIVQVVSKSPIHANCPKCQGQIEITLSQVAAEATVRCGTCGVDIQLTDKDGGARQVIGLM